MRARPHRFRCWWRPRPCRLRVFHDRSRPARGTPETSPPSGRMHDSRPIKSDRPKPNRTRFPAVRKIRVRAIGARIDRGRRDSCRDSRSPTSNRGSPAGSTPETPAPYSGPTATSCKPRRWELPARSAGHGSVQCISPARPPRCWLPRLGSLPLSTLALSAQ